MRWQVLLSEGCPARWRLLQDRLESVCPTETSTVPLWRRSPRGPGGRNPYFLLEVSAPDCVGILHGKCSPCEPSSTLGEVVSMTVRIWRAKNPASCWGVWTDCVGILHGKCFLCEPSSTRGGDRQSCNFVAPGQLLLPDGGVCH